jgi:hypothetical protein
MSSQPRHRFPLYQAQCRVSLDSAFRCTRHNVESVSTALPLYQAQCRVSLDSPFCYTKPNVVLKSTRYCTLLYVGFLVPAFELWKLEIVCKIDFGQTVGTHKNNLYSERLNEFRLLWQRHWQTRQIAVFLRTPLFTQTSRTPLPPPPFYRTPKFITHFKTIHFRLPPRSKRELRTPGLLRSKNPKSLNPLPLTMVPTGCPETSLINYHYSLRNNPEQRSYHLQSFIFRSVRQVTMHIQNLHCILVHKYSNTQTWQKSYMFRPF